MQLLQNGDNFSHRRAKDNLRVGNWDISKQLVYPLLNDYPCGKTLYDKCTHEKHFE